MKYIIFMADAQVSAWLRCAGLSRFAPRFAAALISSEAFLQLSPTDLDALGVDGPADRKRLADLISDLRRSSNSPSSRVIPARASTLHAFRSSSDSRTVLESLADRNAALRAASTDKQPLTRDRTLITRRQSSRLDVSFIPSTMTVSNASGREPPATVTVCVRKRPLSRKETHVNDHDIVSVSYEYSSLTVHELKTKVDLTQYVDQHTFSFDHVFGEHVGNEAVYENTARPLVDTLFSGGRGTCFAYGQTGAGKTFTMAGDGDENPGLYTLAVRDVFDRIRDLERDAWRDAEERGVEDFEPPDPPEVWISFYEIYGTRLQDLLNRGAKLECREDGNSEVQIVGLSERLCEIEEDVLDLVKSGSALRSTGVTGANDDSSRSHAVFQIELREPPSSSSRDDENAAMRETLLRGSKPNVGRDSEKGEEIGRLCFIDLAGSERGSDTSSSTRQTRMEGAEINKSLLALKECIRAMDKRKDHTPFRGSKLTQVLKASFLGKNCRTVMIANISPASSNVEHTLNTLRYSDRVKEIKKERGNRRATITHGATFSHGVNVRGNRIGLPMQPTLSKTASINTDCDGSDDGAISGSLLKTDRKFPSVKGESDADDSASNGRSMARSTTTRRLTRTKTNKTSEHPVMSGQAGNTPSESNGSSKNSRDPRVMLRRASKVHGETIPSRPSLITSMLPRGAGKVIGTERMPRTNSGASMRGMNERDRGTPNNSNNEIDSAVEDVSLVTMRQGQARSGDREARDAETEAKRVASPAMTRQRARQRQERREESGSKASGSDSPSDSREDDSPTDNEQQRREGRVTTVATRRRPPRASNVAESAMKYYLGRAKREELSEEDLLFASSEDLTDATDVADKRRLIAASATGKSLAEQGGDGGDKKEPGANDYNDGNSKVSGKCVSFGTGKRAKRTGRDPYLPRPSRKTGALRAKPSPSSSESDTANDGVPRKELSAEVRQVIRMHHMQIEELMRLTEADVALVNAMEKGKLDTQEYALKLGVNLSQKLDIVKTLQSKLKVLD